MFPLGGIVIDYRLNREIIMALENR